MEYKFSELFSWSSGRAVMSNNGIVPIYGSNGIIGFTDVARYSNKIILGRVGAYCGSVAYCPNEFNATDNTLITTCDENKIQYYYAFYLLKSFKLNNFAGGVAQPLITQSILKHLKCDIPPLPIQRKIASILSAYDNLIENNNKRIKLLEQMAESLYKEWFVRFRFPGHENVEMENGLPKGWNRLYIKSLTQLKSGYAFKSEWFKEDGESVAKIKDIGGILMDTSDFSYVDKVNCVKAKKFLLVEGDLTIALTGATIGKVSIVPRHHGNIYTNQRLGKFFNGNNPIDNLPFLYCLFKNETMTSNIINLSNSSSAQPNISPEQIENIKIIGNISVIEVFNKYCRSIFSMILSLHQQSQLLIRQRDLLLPRLMSGKLEVRP